MHKYIKKTRDHRGADPKGGIGGMCPHPFPILGINN